MRLLVCVCEDVDAERVLVDELSDLDEAVACCRDLVESEGYPRAGVWSAAGRPLFVVQRDGRAIVESELPDEAALLDSSSTTSSHDPHLAPRARRDEGGPRATGRAASPAARTVEGGEGPAPVPDVPAPPPGGNPRPAGLLGESVDSAEQWFGL
ncbi:MAG TPA: hypothetical protein VF048_10880 [Gemmatimonadaceae bacterium]|jgi:hypothetical protein